MERQGIAVQGVSAKDCKGGHGVQYFSSELLSPKRLSLLNFKVKQLVWPHTGLD